MPKQTPHDAPSQPYWVEQAFEDMPTEERFQLTQVMKEEWGWFLKDIEVEFVMDSLEEHPPTWFPEKVNDQVLSPDERLRWFDHILSDYRACLFGSTANTDVNRTRREEAAYCLCQMYHVIQMGELGEPPIFIYDKWRRNRSHKQQ